ncbi:MAG: nucleotidyltransferase family protein [Candidatus Entotheonellia bacterium]
MSAGQTKVRLPKDKIAAFCRRHHIRKLAVFGSVLHGDSRPDSDLDVLVEFEPSHVPGLAFFSMEQELSELLGRKVDLNTPQFLSPYFRDEVLAEAEVQYAAS